MRLPRKNNAPQKLAEAAPFKLDVELCASKIARFEETCRMTLTSHHLTCFCKKDTQMDMGSKGNAESTWIRTYIHHVMWRGKFYKCNSLRRWNVCSIETPPIFQYSKLRSSTLPLGSSNCIFQPPCICSTNTSGKTSHQQATWRRLAGAYNITISAFSSFSGHFLQSHEQSHYLSMHFFN